MEKLGITKGFTTENRISLIYDDTNKVYLSNEGFFLTKEEIYNYIHTLYDTLDYINNNPEQVELWNQWALNQKRVDFESRFFSCKKEDKKEKPIKLTSVYIMKDNHTGHYKIGRSDSPTKREATLLSQKSSIELLFQAKATRSYERSLHNLFNEKRVRGEWFELNDFDVELIKGLLS
jgi:hypothetical protein